MTRAEALGYLANEFSSLLAAAGIAATDTDEGLGAVLDKGLRSIGATEEVATDTLQAFLLFLDYHVLVRICRALAVKVDVSHSSPGMSRASSQAYAQAQAERDRAEQRLREAGLAGPGQWRLGRVFLDSIEPRP